MPSLVLLNLLSNSIFSACSTETRSSRFFESLFFSSFFFFWSPEFHELWYSVMSFGLFTEIKRQWATGMCDRFCALLVSQMALQLALVD